MALVLYINLKTATRCTWREMATIVSKPAGQLNEAVIFTSPAKACAVCRADRGASQNVPSLTERVLFPSASPFAT